LIVREALEKMAVQKNKPSPSRRGHRRSHDSLKNSALSEEQNTGETHRRHHITQDGYYKGKQVIPELEK
tara:strand:- start:171 stop:377 length:207 start_codon:yes stop_codon:yes gene_type:complete